MARIRHDVDFDIFSYERYFPGSIEASQRRFPVYARAWLDGLIAEKGTRSEYQAMVEDLWIPAFGDRPINDVKPSEIRKIIAKRSMQVSAKTVNNNLIPLRGIFQAAVDDGLLEHSPLRNIRNRKHQAPLPDPFTPDEMKRSWTICGSMRRSRCGTGICSPSARACVQASRSRSNGTTSTGTTGRSGFGVPVSAVR